MRVRSPMPGSSLSAVPHTRCRSPPGCDGGARHISAASRRSDRRRLVVVQGGTTSEDDEMDARFNLFDSPTATKLAKRFYNASLAVERSTLPKTVRDLVALRTSQINGCGWCVDIHTKEAVAAGET